MNKHLLTLFFSLCILGLSAQERMLTGSLVDNGEAIMFATVAVYRNDILIRGVETNLDGEYAIACKVGDKIEFSYIGYSPRSIYVTESMLGEVENTQKIKIERIESKAFKQKMRARRLMISNVILKDSINTGKSAKLYHKNDMNSIITDFELVNGKVKTQKPKPDIQYDLTLTQNIGTQFVSPFHQHSLQNTFSQGRPINGILTYQDFNAGETYSYGPRISELSSIGISRHNNDILQPSIKLGTQLAFEAEQMKNKVYGIFNYNRIPDIFNKYKSNHTSLRLGYMKFSNTWNDDHPLNVELNIDRTTLGNHNYTGYYHNALKSMMAQSPSFDGSNEKLESYSPEYENPNWILAHNKNPVTSDKIGLLIKQKWTSDEQSTRLKNALKIESKKTKISENYKKVIEDKLQDYSNTLNIKSFSAQMATNLKYQVDNANNISLVFYNIATFAKVDIVDLNSRNEYFSQSDQLFRNSFSYKFAYTADRLKSSIKITSLLANNQPNSLTNPSGHLSYEFRFRRKRIDKLTPYISAKRIIKEQDLLLDRYNYSSFLIDHNRLQDQKLDYPLWILNKLQNEIKDEFNIGVHVSKRYSRSDFSSRIEYKFIDQKNVIFPELENGSFILRNSADLSTHKLSWVNSWHGYKYIFKERINFNYTFEVSHFKTSVNKLHGLSNRVPIAGFADVSKNLIVGQPVGIIVGSDFNRNADGKVIINDDGWPTKAQELSIIADPTPLLNFAYNLEIGFDQLLFKIEFDGQIGGKVWNGTHQTLDYYGVSQYSADHREIDNHVFEGVKTDGSINTTQVSLADPNDGLSGNMWTRYGTDGIVSEYIRDASHISLKTIELTYNHQRQNSREFKIKLYAKNLLTIASFKGFSTSHIYEDSISYGLQYFNQPITSEIGTSLTYKF